MKKEIIDIDTIVTLSGFEVSNEEKQELRKELQDFLEYAKILESAPCGNIKPANYAFERESHIREDKAEEKSTKELLRCGPAIKGNSYIVPPQSKKSGKDKRKEGQKQYADTYEVVIGLEIHAQLKTKSKLFCSCSTVFGKTSNENTCPVCSGHPGVLPVLNKEVVNMAILAGLALECTINEHSVFARKNYFYPDLPKAYQISQFTEPICSNGEVKILIDGKIKTIRLNRIHIEEDAGKMVHIGAPGIWGSKASAVDFNRTGVPLIEIVSEPDIRSPKEAKEYVMMLRAILKTLEICDGNMQEGSLRCDANVSLRKLGEEKLGTKTEIKNMNSFKAIERALEFEIDRQRTLLKQGFEIEQQTRLWDESAQKTYLMRSKEDAHDYRYFPDPDLLPLKISKKWIEEVRKRLTDMPLVRKERYKKMYELSEKEANLFMHTPEYAKYFEKTYQFYKKPRVIANWFFSELMSYIDLNTHMENLFITPEDFAQFLQKQEQGEISGKIGKTVIKEAFKEQKKLMTLIEEQELKQITDPEILEKWIMDVLAKNEKQQREYKSGKQNVFHFFVGQVMKLSHGKASPEIVKEILKKN